MAELGQEQVRRLRSAVQRAYSAAAENPAIKHAFPVGRRFAESLGYPVEVLAALPADSVDAFAGVSNVAVFAEIAPGSIVLDLGCGAGVDSLIAARRVGVGGRVIGIDFSDAMLARARRAAETWGARITFCRAEGERLPLRPAAVDVALVNGIFNLNPVRDALFRELARVVRPGGAVYAAELVTQEAVCRTGPVSDADWFS